VGGCGICAWESWKDLEGAKLLYGGVLKCQASWNPKGPKSLLGICVCVCVCVAGLSKQHPILLLTQRCDLGHIAGLLQYPFLFTARGWIRLIGLLKSPPALTPHNEME